MDSSFNSNSSVHCKTMQAEIKMVFGENSIMKLAKAAFVISYHCSMDS